MSSTATVPSESILIASWQRVSFLNGLYLVPHTFRDDVCWLDYHISKHAGVTLLLQLRERQTDPVCISMTRGAAVNKVYAYLMQGSMQSRQQGVGQ